MLSDQLNIEVEQKRKRHRSKAERKEMHQFFKRTARQCKQRYGGDHAMKSLQLWQRRQELAGSGALAAAVNGDEKALAAHLKAVERMVLDQQHLEEEHQTSSSEDEHSDGAEEQEDELVGAATDDQDNPALRDFALTPAKTPPSWSGIIPAVHRQAPMPLSARHLRQLPVHKLPSGAQTERSLKSALPTYMVARMVDGRGIYAQQLKQAQHNLQRMVQGMRPMVDRVDIEKVTSLQRAKLAARNAKKLEASGAAERLYAKSTAQLRHEQQAVPLQSKVFSSQ